MLKYVFVGDVVQMTTPDGWYGYRGCFSMYIAKMPADPSVSGNKGEVQVTFHSPDTIDLELKWACNLPAFSGNYRVKFYDFT